MERKSFGSDNHSGVHPRILEAIAAANHGDCVAYGADPWTARLEARCQEIFGPCEVFPVFNGTGANVLSLQAATRPYHGVICAASSHLHTDECGAPENFTGCKLVTVPAPDGRLSPALLEPLFAGRHDEHHSKLHAVSITQSTELGTVYTPDEIRALADFAHRRGLVLHVDGARLCNAAASLDVPLRAISGDCGIDLLSFGGTKNGLLQGEAVVVFRPELARDLRWIRKQGMQLSSKMRFLSAQLLALLDGELWRENAAHANRMAGLLARAVRDLPGVEIVQPTQVNAVFARIPREVVEPLRERYFFYTWDESLPVVRWMCSFDTREEDVRDFAATLEGLLRAR